jgi:hypothetical protein
VAHAVCSHGCHYGAKIGGQFGKIDMTVRVDKQFDFNLALLIAMDRRGVDVREAQLG